LREKLISTRGYAEIHIQRPIFDNKKGIQKTIVLKIQMVSTCHNILELMLGWSYCYSANHFSKSLLKKEIIPFLSSNAHSSTATCSVGSNGSTKFLESLLSLIPFQSADPTLFSKCYGFGMSSIYKIFKKRKKKNLNFW
jgi:hypothetical protein